MGGELRPSPCFSHARAKQKLLIRKGACLFNGFGGGVKRTEIRLTVAVEGLELAMRKGLTGPDRHTQEP